LTNTSSTGGAALEVGRISPNKNSDLENDLDYVSVFHRHLSISVREERYVDPALQPSVVEERYWKREANVEMKEG
jgi:hypothetical protein